MDKPELKGFDVDVDLESGMLVLKGEHAGKVGGAKVEISLSLDAVVDAIEEKIPGDQKAAATVLKGILAGIKV